jgi:hypothetical protein
VLLALLALPQDATWAEASNPTLRTVEIMDLIRQHYGRDYKPNTRETIRRQTLHQFADVALVLQKPRCTGQASQLTQVVLPGQPKGVGGLPGLWQRRFR